MNPVASRRRGGARVALTRRKDFDEVYTHGRRARGGGVTVTAAPSQSPGGPSRLGLVVPRSAGPAVTRNRIRRRLRAAAEQLRPEAGFDIVLRGDERVAKADFWQLVDDLKGALSAVGVSCDQ